MKAPAISISIKTSGDVHLFNKFTLTLIPHRSSSLLLILARQPRRSFTLYALKFGGKW
jgi:hypothetical protein